MGLKVTILGSTVLTGIFKSVGQAVFMRGVGEALYEEGNRIMNESKRRVPLEDGPLRASGTVERPIISGTHFSITLGYGGAASAYALIQHENMSFRHPGRGSKRGGQTGRGPKYLEIPVQQAGPSIESGLANYVRGYFTPMGGR